MAIKEFLLDLTPFGRLRPLFHLSLNYRSRHEAHSLFRDICRAGEQYGALAAGAIATDDRRPRTAGVTLSTHFFRGEYWVAGHPVPGTRSEVRNGIGGRVLAVTSVDGVNVLSGATAGWIRLATVRARERYQITGGERLTRKWRLHVHRFTEFLRERNRAARERPGVIGVALFRERRPQPVYAPPKIAQSPGHRKQRGPGSPTGIGEPLDGQGGGGPGVTGTDARPKLGTGHGEREYSTSETPNS